MDSADNKKTTDPGVSAILSFIFTGLGQIYNGQIAKGLFMMSVTIVAVVVAIIGAAMIAYTLLTGIIGNTKQILGFLLLGGATILMIIVGVYNIYDAYNTAKKKS